MTLRFTLAALSTLGALAILPAAAQTSPTAIPAAAFFENASFSTPRLSPDGRLVAIKVAGKSGRVRLAVVDAATRKTRVVAAFDDADINRYHWVNDQRLVFNVGDLGTAQGEVRWGGGLWAVNADGSELRQLVRRDSAQNDGISKIQNKLLPWNTFMYSGVGNLDSDEIFVTQYEYGATGWMNQIALLRLNTSNGKFKTYAHPANTMGWVVDRQGVPRITVAYRDNQQVIFHRTADDQPWTQLASFKLYPSTADNFEPQAFGPDGTLYVRASLQGADALYPYDIANRKLGDKPAISTPGYDLQGQLEYNQDKVQGYHYEVDAKGTWWVDATMKAVQQAVDAALPATNNMISTPLRPTAPYVLVESSSDVQPAVYRLYNTETHSLSMLGGEHPAIAPELMSTKAMVRYKARDGLEIPAYLTTPKASKGKNLPLVVLVHGGPWVRGVHWDWDAEVQFLASRGYAVLEPEFRGSTGYGHQLFTAGWKQWGLKMQDDVADGARWAIAQGIADSKRICIAGASYGGYATLMGLVNDPDLYKCGVAWAGVTDLNILKDGHWTSENSWSTGGAFDRFGFPVLIGGDAAQLAATSPLQQAARIKQPLLLAHGGADQTVPIIHGTAFKDAVSKNNSSVEWVLYADEGHGWFLPQNRIDFWGKVEKFLDKHIGASAP
ncbi:prolyl oligopeptidase family serine peptidase [Duganella sp. FT135W]|uniref:Prolyl oligopeptidase family serine peptidase n=1 Tax=Duganella flavida TaxID=2692175 RepID=A0A6L8K7U1_9BURK|nr:prolyl oligopeptidase family serine peptidase [Duganella flavida]MYM23456.1 prolyl oligopeptidase family serine peptidase [Duganella flavida]